MSDDIEDPLEREEQAIVLRYLEQATPAQWHLYAARSNDDGNRYALEWLTDTVETRRPVPEAMYAIVPGSEWVGLDDDAYDEGLPMDVAERIEALYDDAASRASSILSTRAKGGHKSRTTGAWTVVQWGH